MNEKESTTPVVKTLSDVIKESGLKTNEMLFATTSQGNSLLVQKDGELFRVFTANYTSQLKNGDSFLLDWIGKKVDYDPKFSGNEDEILDFTKVDSIPIITGRRYIITPQKVISETIKNMEQKDIGCQVFMLKKAISSNNSNN